MLGKTIAGVRINRSQHYAAKSWLTCSARPHNALASSSSDRASKQITRASRFTLRQIFFCAESFRDSAS
jgi:hypothetical protein